ncbi:hypothetical protein MACJ_003231 [Theileria orientalis]|uniref:CPW-WPC domain-containing protein n=1 Tax=Theileria orientalis TaxID=68886 RepID=A0A976QTB0_THEOR|nr:hypothetical protein MACJ_003231 [Theileria orientalis]
MFLFKKIILGYIIIVIFIIGKSIELDNDKSDNEEKILASGISEDMSKLSENVDNVVEAYAEEDESDDSETPEEKKKRKIDKKFADLYKKEFEKAQKVVDKQYSKYVKGRFESLDLVEYATEQLKRFWFTGQCRRNYNQKCPKGWVEYNDSCKAPGDYRGLCNDLKDFTAMGPEEKEDFAWRCEVEWPCINGSEQNLKIISTEKPIFEGVECPFEWAPISETLCLAPKTYDGICSPIMDVSNFDVAKKSLYEQKCILQKNIASSGDVRWRRVSTKKLNSEKTSEQFEQNKISGIIDDGIIRII